MINCLECKKLTTNPKFCSQSCSATHNNKKNPRKLKKYYCKKCGILLCEGWKQQKNKWLCSKCNPNFKDWNNITLKDFKDGRSIYKAPKVSGADIVRIESDLEQSLKCDVVYVMSVQELDADDD
jgi:hypothetical protein